MEEAEGKGCFFFIIIILGSFIQKIENLMIWKLKKSVHHPIFYSSQSLEK